MVAVIFVQIMKMNCTHKVLTALFVIYICIEKSGFLELRIKKYAVILTYICLFVAPSFFFSFFEINESLFY